MLSLRLPTLLPTFLFLTGVLASPVPAEKVVEVTKRQSDTYCGNNFYSASQVSEAVSVGCNYYQEGSEAGSSTYPHTEKNYEGFDFAVSGPYQEFPILSSGEDYDGGAPGPDRVVFNTNCEWAGTVTHTGASGNDFVGCSGTS